MAHDPAYLAHREWLGYVQPVGLVVSIPALLAAQAHLNRHIAPEHQRFLACLPRDRHDDVISDIRDFAKFTQTVLGWEPTDLTAIPDVATLPEELAPLEVVLPEYHETLRSTYSVRELAPRAGQSPWLMLIQCLPAGTDLDAPMAASARHWHASPHARCERLLRETGVPIGLLVNGTHLRLIYAPRGESSGSITFAVTEMAQVAGRPIFAGLHLLLAAERLFSLPEHQRLPAILAESRKYQNTVSTQLAEQVLAALYELLRGFQAADDQRHGALLHDVLATDPNHVYAGLLTVLMRLDVHFINTLPVLVAWRHSRESGNPGDGRHGDWMPAGACPRVGGGGHDVVLAQDLRNGHLVFILYAEDRGLLPSDPLYANSYAVAGLFERLREDAGRHPDTMDLRYGAWAQLLALFRLIYDGGRHGALHLPARQGYLFDPDRYPFLEGRPYGARRNEEETWDLPRLADGVMFRVLNNLLILDGERLSYQTLDVEQIGSVYEAMMGFYLDVAQGRSIAIKPTRAHGAPTTINLEALLAIRPQERVKWLADQTDQKLTGQAADALKSAALMEELLAALDRRIAKHVTPHVVPAGSMVLQPSDERRRSGSHYTPRSLTEPIVRTTLQPILARLGDTPMPEQILELKICDPAMGSGAFLVEVCRLLGDELVKAWHVHDGVPIIPPDEDEILHARRLVAQRCLYGVDKNPMAVDLAKLSLWLATLAKNHPFTFLDHSLRCGDALVGLTKEQIVAFHWHPSKKPTTEEVWFGDPIAERMQRAMAYRQRILAARDAKPYAQLRQELGVADDALSLVKLTGDLVIAAFFAASKDRERVERLNALARQLVKYLGRQGRIEDGLPLTEAAEALRCGEKPIAPFHWEIEFPEVFGRENGGFDAMVGNPPFAGVVTLSRGSHAEFTTYLRAVFPRSAGKADLVAFFFRQAFRLLRHTGTCGLLATNTVRQGDTRESGLSIILSEGGLIYNAITRKQWPGLAAVIVSIVHIVKSTIAYSTLLNGRSVERINAYLVHGSVDESPAGLISDKHGIVAALGNKPNGTGFIFSDRNTDCLPLSRKDELLASHARNNEVLKPYMGGNELNSSPTLTTDRWIIDFESLSLEEAHAYPDLLAIVEERVKPYVRRENWWQFDRRAVSLQSEIRRRHLTEVLIIAETSDTFAFAFGSSHTCYSNKIVAFSSASHGLFAALQSRVHETWVRMVSSTFKDDLSYVPRDCFETFPLPLDWPPSASLSTCGQTYYQYRSDLMVCHNWGLTDTYNHFHDPRERSSDIKKLHELHDAMDRAVLDAYGWTDLVPTCEFLLDYEEDEDDEEGSSRRKKPWRYRWPDDVRDEVLARLLELNTQRAEQERLAGLTAEAAAGMSQGRKKPSGHTASRRKRQSPNTVQPNLLESGYRL